MMKVVKTIAMVFTVAVVACAVSVVALVGINRNPINMAKAVIVSTQNVAGTVIEVQDYNAYVNTSAGLNVREAANTQSRILNAYGLNTMVHVTGKVLENGVDTGWLRIDTVNTATNIRCDGFVRAEYLSNAMVTVVYTQVDKSMVEGTAEYSQAMMESDAIANVIDQAEDSCMFSQEEIDDTISEITELQNQRCTTEAEKQAQSDRIAEALNEMQQ